jgi:hypothetical protein
LAVIVLVPSFVVIVTEVSFATALLVATKLTLLDPTGTVTVAGTVTAAGRDDVSVIGNALPAISLTSTEPLAVSPPTTCVGSKVKAVIMNGFTVSAADWLAPPNVALIVGLAVAATLSVVTINVPVCSPDGIVIDAGTVAAVGTVLSNTTFAPLAGAGPVNVTVPVTTV